MLRDYQQALVDQIQYHLAEEYQRILLYAPTGAGKTVIAVHLLMLALAQGQRGLFVVRHEPLIAQTIQMVAAHGLTCGVIKAGYPQDPEQPIQVASIQTLNRRRQSWPEADWVILDEAHGTTARQYDGLFWRYDGAVVIGPTATPFRLTRRQPLSDRYDAIVAGPQTIDLIEAGYLVRPIVYGYPPELLDLRTVKTIAGDYCRQDIAIRCDTTAMISQLVQEWQRCALGRRTLVFAVNRQHARNIAQAFAAAGIPSDYLDGDTPWAERQLKYQRLRLGETRILSNCAVLAEGFNEPSVDALILARPTKSKALYLQQVGRGLRLSAETGKTDCIIIDQAGNSWRLGLPTDRLVLNLEGNSSTGSGLAPVKCCPVCRVVNAMGVRQCENCGHVFPDPRYAHLDLPVALETLQEQDIDPTVVALMLQLKRKQEQSKYKVSWVYFAFVKQHRQPTLPELQVLGELLGYQPGWAWYRWRELSGVRYRYY